MSRRPSSAHSRFRSSAARFRSAAQERRRKVQNPLRSERRLNHETLEKRELLAADLLAVRPDAGALIGEDTVLQTPPREISLLFNGTADLNEATIDGNVRLVRAGGDGTFGDGNEVAVSLGYVGLVDPGDVSEGNLHKIVLRPSSIASHNATDPSIAFPDDLYRVEIIGSGANPLEDNSGDAFNDGEDSITEFRLDRGAQVIAVIPQPVTRDGAGNLEANLNRVDVYFDQEMDATEVVNTSFYRFVDSNNSAAPVLNPSSVDYFPGENRAQLNFLNDTDLQATIYRLDIGSDATLPGSGTLLPASPFSGEIGTAFGDYINGATDGDFGLIGSGTISQFASQISAAGSVSLPARPGGIDEPGHREIQLENHYLNASFEEMYGVDQVAPLEIEKRYYAFPANFQSNGVTEYENFITPSEKEIARGILEIYAQQIGVEFIETDDRDDPRAPTGVLVIGKGDLQAADPEATSGPGGTAGLGGGNIVVLDKDDFTESERSFGDSFTSVLFHEIAHALDAGHAYELAALQGQGVPGDVEPGDDDIVHLQRVSPPNANDIDLYKFSLDSPGTVQIETIAERLTLAEHGKETSTLDTVLRLFRRNDDGTSELIAQNDRYFGSDSYLDVELEAGDYYFGVSSAGNDQYDPAIADSGFGGVTDGEYELRLSFSATPNSPATSTNHLVDTDGTLLDGDGDGTAGGVHSFWFEVAADTIYVDKLSTAAAPDGSLASPYSTIAPALLAAQGGSRTLVRIVGNIEAGDSDGLLTATPYLLGLDTAGNSLADGSRLDVPANTTVRIEAGALLKLRATNIDVGTSSIGAVRAEGAIQVLGTPDLPVYLRSFRDDAAGGNTDGTPTNQATAGDYGGIVIRSDSDLEDDGVYLNTINHADIQNGGGKSFQNSTRVFSPIDIDQARPTISFNTITNAGKAAISASPDSFDDSNGRIGPDIEGNYLSGNTDNGLFIGIPTNLGSAVQQMTVSGRFDDTDITHILTESLIITGNPGGPEVVGGVLSARASGRLMIDPGTVIKLQEARIEAERGAATLIAEGTPDKPIIFTSLDDNRYGGSGVFDTNSGIGAAAAGDWGGIFFSQGTQGSIDHAVITYGGGVVPTGSTGGGAADRFNAVEIHQADVRIANTLITQNASGNAASDRFGRGNNQAAAIYVRGSQPILIGNQIVDNDGPAININADSLQFQSLVDPGRSTGAADRYSEFDDNRGPLIRLNELDQNETNGLYIRGEELTTESIWDDSDIVHVLAGEILIGNHHTYSGLRLQSNVSESLVVKVIGNDSGFTATGTPLDIDDRIGGTIQVIGLPGYPVVITHIKDDTVGAGFTPDGRVMFDTDNADTTVTVLDEWRGFLFDEWSNDSNVAIIREAESPLTGGNDINSNPVTKAQPLGALAPDQKSGDENRRLGFEVQGYISPDDATDIDVYSFSGEAGTKVWFDIDRTYTSLDLVLEVVLDDGTDSGSVLAAIDQPADATLIEEPLLGGDFYSLSNNDPGGFMVLPSTGTYYVRVKAAAVDHDNNPATDDIPVTKGEYQLQIRLQQVDEFPGSTVRYADVRYANFAFDIDGLPRHSPLVGDAVEVNDAPDSITGQDLGNLLETDIAALSIAGSLASATDVDVFAFDVSHEGTQVIPGVTEDTGTVAVVFDLDYAAEKRGDTSIAVFNANQELIFIGRDSNVEDDQPEVGGDGKSLDDLSRGSLGTDDPYIGPVHLNAGEKYYVAVMSNQSMPSVLASQFSLTGPNGTGDAGILTRLEPANSVDRVVEDHIGFTGYTSYLLPVDPTTAGPLLDISTKANLDDNITAFRFADVPLFIATDSAGNNGDNFYTHNPFTGELDTDLTPDSDNLVDGEDDIQDIVIRGDGLVFGYQAMVPANAADNDHENLVGRLSQLDPATGDFIAGTTQDDNIPGTESSFNVSSIPDPEDTNGNSDNRTARAQQVTNTDGADAVTFRRRATTGPAAAPVPVYETYYAVSEGDSNGGSRLFRGDASGDATPTPATSGVPGTPQYGLVGNIQVAGVEYASGFISVSNNAADPVTTRIYLRSVVPGEDGNVTVEFGTDSNNANTTVSYDAGANTITIRRGTGGNPRVVTATAQDIVNAINESTQVSNRIVAVIYDDGTGDDGANGTVALNATDTTLTGGVGTEQEALQGRVTGLSMGNFDGSGPLYGVTDAGEFILININDQNLSSTDPAVAEATVLSVAEGVQFSGLTLGPQNVNGGMYKNVLFATTEGGRVYAFDTSGNPVQAFNSGNASQLITVAGAPTASGTFTLTFDDGNGNVDTTVPIDANAPAVDSLDEVQTVTVRATAGTFTLTYDDGVSSEETAAIPFDATETDIANALGLLPNLNGGDISVTYTDPVAQSLATGVNVTFGGNLTWNNVAELVMDTSLLTESATLSDVLTVSDGSQSVQDALLDLTNIDVGDIRLIGDFSTGGVTVLFSGQYAGTDVALMVVDETGLLLGTTAAVAIAGTSDDEQADDFRVSLSGLDGAPVGLAFSPLDFNLWHPTTLRANDAGHGINDAPDSSRDPGDVDVTIVDGITGGRDSNQAEGGASFYFGFEQWVNNPNANTDSYITPADVAENAQYGLSTLQHQDLSSNTDLLNTYDFAGGAKGSLVTNEFSLAGSVYDDRPTFYFNYLLETEAATGRNVDDVTAERYFSDSARVYAWNEVTLEWELLATNSSLLSGEDASEAGDQAELPTFLSHVADAGVNSSDPQPETKQIVQELFDEDPTDPLWHQARVDLSRYAGNTNIRLRFEFSTSGSSIQADLPGDSFGDASDADGENSVGALDNNHIGFFIDDFIVGYAERGEMVTNAPSTVGNAFVDLGDNTRTDVRRDDDALTNALSGDYQLEVRRTGEYGIIDGDELYVFTTYDTNERHILDLIEGSWLDADVNRERVQGMLILENNVISSSRFSGIRLDQTSDADTLSGLPTPGPTINFSDKDDDRFVPGVVIQNNIIAESQHSGILYTGLNLDGINSRPIDRIINNTIIGTDGGFGVVLSDAASPTLLNNVFVDLGFAITFDELTDAVIDNNFFQNAGGTWGTDARTDNNPLFRDPEDGNYYPADGAGTINNSQNVLQDRGAYANFKEILGIPNSPFFAPTLDVLGQLRVSGGVGGGGGGQNSDIDIGAIDFSDQTAPHASLLNPFDVFENRVGDDTNLNETVLRLDGVELEVFSLLLSDGENPESPFEGTGIDPETVNENTVIVRQNNRILTPDEDFRLAFNPSTGELRLTPLSDLWEPNAVYEIILMNNDQAVVSLTTGAGELQSGASVADEDTVTVSDGVNTSSYEFDAGYVLQLNAVDTIEDGQTFSYSTATGTDGYTARFQFERIDDAGVAVGSLAADVALDNLPVGSELALSVGDSMNFAAGDFIRIGSEIMAVVGIADGTTLTVQRAVLGSQKAAHQSTGGTDIFKINQGERAIVQAGLSAMPGSPMADVISVMQADSLGLDLSSPVAQLVRIGDEIMRVTAFDATTVTVQRGYLGTAIQAHDANSLIEVVSTSRSATMTATQTAYLAGPAASPQSVTGASLLASDHKIEVTPSADFQPVVGDLLQIGNEFARILAIDPAGSDLSLTLERGLFGTMITEVLQTTEYTVPGDTDPTSFATPIQLVDSSLESILILESDSLDDSTVADSVGGGADSVRLGIASKIAQALREFGMTEPGVRGDLDLRIPQAQSLEGGRVYIGGHVGDTISSGAGSVDSIDVFATIVSEPGTTTADAVAIPFIPSVSFPQRAVVAGLLEALNNDDSISVTGTSEGGNTFYLEGDNGVAIEDISFTSTSAGFQASLATFGGIKDLAGNALRANRGTETRFTIGLGTAAADYGDEADTSGDDKARHQILTSEALLDDPRFGSPTDPAQRVVDAEATQGTAGSDDASGPVTALQVAISASETLISVTAGDAASFAPFVGGYLDIEGEVVRLTGVDTTGDLLEVVRGQFGTVATDHADAGVLPISLISDDENGLDTSSVYATFNVDRTTATDGGPVLITVSATDYGVVDGWLDFSGDGVLQAGERVFNHVAVWPGENVLEVEFPASYTGVGNHVLRLRISQLGGLSADGLAVGGEVEDHVVDIVDGLAPTLADLLSSIDVLVTDESSPVTNVVGDVIGATDPAYNSGDTIEILEIVDLRTGRAYPIDGTGTATIENLTDSLGRIAGQLTVDQDGNVTFVPQSNYDSGNVVGPDEIPGTADDLTPELTFGYRLVSSTGNIAGTETMTVTLTVNPVNQNPTLGIINGGQLVTLNEDEPDEQVFGLQGISAGGNDVEPVHISVATRNVVWDAVSSSYVDAEGAVELIASPSIVGLDDNAYDGGSTQAQLKFSTTADQYGTAEIVVTVSDTPGLDGVLGTADDYWGADGVAGNADDFWGADGVLGGGDDSMPATQTLIVTVNPVNDQPIAYDRAWASDEVIEQTDPVTNVLQFNFSRADLLGEAGSADPANDPTAVDPGGSGAAPFDESNQELKIHRLVFGSDALITFTHSILGPQVWVPRELDFRQLVEPGATFSSVTVQFTNTNGVVTGHAELFHDGNGEFTNGTYTPTIDLNDSTTGIPQEFQYIVTDDGKSILPNPVGSTPNVEVLDTQGLVDPVEISAVEAVRSSEPRKISFSVTSQTDEPFLGEFKPLVFDEAVAGAPAIDLLLADLFVDANESFMLGIGADEQMIVDPDWITITPIASNVVDGATALVLPTPEKLLDASGAIVGLRLSPVVDAYGEAGFLVTINNPAVNPIGTTPRERWSKTLSVTINPINDQPIAYDREWVAAEVIERADPVVSTLQFAFTKDDLFGAAGSPNPALDPTPVDPGGSGPSPFNEDNQFATLKVHQLIFGTDATITYTRSDITDVNGDPVVQPWADPILDFRDPVFAVPGVSSVKVEFTNAAGVVTGQAELFHSNGEFTSGTYTPTIDINDSTAGVPQEFEYVVTDDGTSVLPNPPGAVTESVDTDGVTDPAEVDALVAVRDADPKKISFSVTAQTDEPFLGELNHIWFDEALPGAPAIELSLTDLFVDPSESFMLGIGADEQVVVNPDWITITPVATNVVDGLGNPLVLPTPEKIVDAFGAITGLRLSPIADAYGEAGFVITIRNPAVNADPIAERDRWSKTLSVTINPINDQPVAYDRAWVAPEVIERVDPVVSTLQFAFTKEDLFGGAGTPNPAIDSTPVNPGGSGPSPFNEDNQFATLKVHQLVFGTDATITYTRDDLVGEQTWSVRELDFRQLVEAGVVFSSVKVEFTNAAGVVTGQAELFHSNGEFTNGTYTPTIDINNATEGVPQEFEYIVTDDGTSVLPNPAVGAPTESLDTDGLTDPVAIDAVIDVRDSAPRTVSFGVAEETDEPFLGEFNHISLNETEAGLNVFELNFADLFVDPSQTFLLGKGADEQLIVDPSWVTITPLLGNPVDVDGDPILLPTPEIFLDGFGAIVGMRFEPIVDAYGEAGFVVTIRNPSVNPDSVPVRERWSKTLSVTVNPVNDKPGTEDRVVSGLEGETHLFDSDNLVLGTANIPAVPPVAPVSAVPGAFDTQPNSLFDESEQSVFVSSFTGLAFNGASRIIDLGGTTFSASDDKTDTSPELFVTPHGFVTLFFTDASGEIRFDRGEFTPKSQFIDYFADDAAAALAAGDFISYTVSDEGGFEMYGPSADGTTTELLSTVALDGSSANPTDLQSKYSDPQTITFFTISVNDQPIAQDRDGNELFPNEVTFFEDQPTAIDGSIRTSIFPALSEIVPGPDNELDQTILLPLGLTQIPNADGLMPQLFVGDSTPTLTTTGLLTVVPKPDAWGTAVYELTITDSEGLSIDPKPLLTITIDAVNDQPVAFDRSIRFDEGGSRMIDPIRLLTPSDASVDPLVDPSAASETDAIANPVDLDPDFAEPDDLEIAEILIPDGEGGTTSITESTVVTTLAGATMEFVFSTSALTGEPKLDSINYTPVEDYNENQPFNPTDNFSYVVRDTGKKPGDVDGNSHLNLSLPASVEISVAPINDLPIFDANYNSVITVGEVETNGAIRTRDLYNGIEVKVFPGPAGALDELSSQTVSFELVSASYADIDGNAITESELMFAPPQLQANGTIEISPVADAFGSANYTYRVVDSEGGVSADLMSFQVVVNNVNDAPLPVAVDPVSKVLTADAGYKTFGDGTISLTLAEDNGIAQIDPALSAAELASLVIDDASSDFDGVTPYFIPVNQTGVSPLPGNDFPGLLDMFISGPENESYETLSLAEFGTLRNGRIETDLGGWLVRSDDAFVTGRGVDVGDIGLLYYPPRDVNTANNIPDSFNFIVTDDDATDPKTTEGVVRFLLNPVNDAPEFAFNPAFGGNGTSGQMPTVQVGAGSGASGPFSLITVQGAGPVTAEDEVDATSGTQQLITYAVTSPDLTDAELDAAFVTRPSIDAQGRLTFEAAAGVVGTFTFDVVATDNGPTDSARGDNPTSITQTFAVEITGKPTTNTPVPNMVRTGTYSGGSVAIDLDDLFTSQTPLDLATISITASPTNGSAEVDGGEIVYTPNLGYSGPDQLTFVVSDSNGVSSDPVTVNYNMTKFALTNPIDPSDVNRDGSVTPFDALLVINLLNSGGDLPAGGIPISDILAENPLGEPFQDFYYDTSDDSDVTPLDALKVINTLNEQASVSEPELLAQVTADYNQLIGLDDAGSSEPFEAVSLKSEAKVVTGAEVESELLELIVADQTDVDDETDSQSNLDSVISELF
ncbi:Ig-like domain-containing protein [Neorhodopirellula lusitana]|uniref:Ig-like domain-containing protein n=1 Tax=Neorhodopirellula lusitana TaxID=445327 RepID=UPI00384F7E03